ncbi:endonuclease/exonuclease/phosphatase family protein [Portibacter marinus]|uniref:endonuclease/exonuclease/phosphatase family protein n=1 Tax=Portibacter marinus TaxID=2898660 RepID=UPI001F23784B|nr:endonuclease/exonuclease/phosphatase family protein [Portibacter marinus]
MTKKKSQNVKLIDRAFVLLIAILIFNPLFCQQYSDSSVQISVLTFNILGGRTTNGSMDLDLVANVIKEADPDFVAMQEVDFRVNRSGKRDLVMELGSRTSMIPIFARAMYYDGGEYGEGMLSKYSFISTRNIALPAVGNQEPRAAIEIVVELPSGDTIAIVGTHFAHEGPQGRIIQAKKLASVYQSYSYPVILAGDLNAEPASEEIELLENVWTSTYDVASPQATYPSDKPHKKIDYIMFKPSTKWSVVERRIICDTLASDHCAYLVTFQLLP